MSRTVALSLLMIAAAGLLIRSWRRLLMIDPGFRSDGVLVTTVNTRPARLPVDRRGETYRRILERLRAMPGVASASAAWITPLGQNSLIVIDVAGFTPASATDADVRLNQVSDSYFRTIGTPILAGRDFRDG